jgi:ABC-type uncharacterized transport system auxiliary subunit
VTGTKLGVSALLCVLLLAGCFPGSKPYTVQFYSLEYLSSTPTDVALNELVRIGRFPAAPSYNTSAMLYRPEPHKVATYNYHRWRTNPGDMVTEHLLNDFRSSGLFHAVFSYRDAEEVRFVVDGDLEEFLLSRTGQGWEAVLSVEMSLRCTDKTVPNRKILFQKRYRTAEPLTKESPEEFAGAMSRAMARVSAEIIDDVCASIKARAGDDQALR